MKRSTKRKHDRTSEFFNIKRRERKSREDIREKQRQRVWRREVLV